MRTTNVILSALFILVISMSLALQSTQAAPVQTLTVDATATISQINYPFWGVNYVAFWDNIQGSVASRKAMKNAGIQLIRFPGGEPANWLDWSKPDRSPYWTTTSTDDLWSYAQGVGAELLLQTNPTSNEISDTHEKNNPAGSHAAGWVTYTAEHNINAKYWEIGNEADLHSTADWDWSGQEWYFNAFNAQAAAMKAANPNIKVFGPVATNAWYWWGLHSLDMFMARAGNRQGSGLVDGVSLHYYAVDGCVGWDNVRAVAQGWPANMDHIKEVIAAYDTRPLPLFISETNAAVGGMNCEINQTMASALANADLFGAYRATGVQAIQAFGAIHGSNGWGLLYGSGESRAADTPTPTYFVFPIWTRSGNQVLRVTGMSDPAAGVSAYASRSANGNIQVVIVNKGSAATPLNINVNGANLSGGSVKIYELKPASGSVSDKDVIYNGVRMPDVTAASLPAPFSRSVTGASFSWTPPAYSLTLLDFDPLNSAPTLDKRVYTPVMVR